MKLMKESRPTFFTKNESNCELEPHIVRSQEKVSELWAVEVVDVGPVGGVSAFGWLMGMTLLKLLSDGCTVIFHLIKIEPSLKK